MLESCLDRSNGRATSPTPRRLFAVHWPNAFLKDAPDAHSKAHFVIKIALSEVPTNADLATEIKGQLAEIAAETFGDELMARVANCPSPGSVLRKLVLAVDESVPVAVLVDDYDYAITQNEHAGHISALRSLMGASKGRINGRITHFVVTGAAQVGHVSLLSGANNFADLTLHPLVCDRLVLRRQKLRLPVPKSYER